MHVKNRSNGFITHDLIMTLSMALLIIIGCLAVFNLTNNSAIEKDIKKASQQSELNKKVLSPLIECLDGGTARLDCISVLVSKAEHESEKDNVAKVFSSDKRLLRLLTAEQKAKLIGAADKSIQNSK
jgi:hypothetical protein